MDISTIIEKYLVTESWGKKPSPETEKIKEFLGKSHPNISIKNIQILNKKKNKTSYWVSYIIYRDGSSTKHTLSIPFVALNQ